MALQFRRLAFAMGGARHADRQRGRRADRPGAGLFPMSDLEQVDTWFVAGMKSSGSISLKATTPSFRAIACCLCRKPSKAITRPKCAARKTSIALPSSRSWSIILVGPILGLGRAALDFVRQKANSRTIAYTFFDKQSASVAFQLQVAEAAMMIDTAHFHAYRAAEDVDRGGRARRLSRYVHTRAGAGRYRLYGRENHPGHRKAVVRAGSAGFADASPLQRIWRDAAVASRHAVVLPPIGYELSARRCSGSKITSRRYLSAVELFRPLLACRPEVVKQNGISTPTSAGDTTISTPKHLRPRAS